MGSYSTSSDIGNEDEPWRTLREHRELLEEIVAEDEPFAPEAEKLLRLLDRREEGD